jgi:predicted AAA+ superfamily ATPase
MEYRSEKVGSSPDDVLKSILVTGQERPLPEVVARDFDAELVQRHNLLTVIGPRRAGKTFACYQMMRFLRDRGVGRERMLYLNLEDERLTPPDSAFLSRLLDTHTELFGTDFSQPFFCFVDEIQNVPAWSKWARRVTDEFPRLHLVLTGSSSKLLSTEIATELRGRSLSITILPYSFREYLRARGIEPGDLRTLGHSRRNLSIRKAFQEYRTQGGFPGVVGKPDRAEILQQYYRTMFLRDLVDRHGIRNSTLYDQFLKIALGRFGSLVSVSNLANSLPPTGPGCSKNTLVEYLDHAVDAFLLQLVPRFSTKVTEHIRHPRKLYAVDTGLLDAVRFSMSDDRGRVLENMVALELRRRNGDLFHFHDTVECDFVVMDRAKCQSAIQVCWDLSATRTMDRELTGLVIAMESFKLKEGLILTESIHEDLKVEGKAVRVRPFWLWALEKE